MAQATPPDLNQAPGSTQQQWDVSAWQAQQNAQWQERTQALEAQNAQAQQELAQARARLAELEQAQTKEQFTSGLTDIDTGDFEYITEEAAREIKTKLLAPVLEKVAKATSMQVNQGISNVQATVQNTQQGLSQLQESQQRLRYADTNSKLLSSVPDIDAVIHSPEYKAFIAQNVPGTFVTRSSQIARAYEEGDVNYIVNMVNEFKSGKPTLESIAGAPLSQGNTMGTIPASGSQTYSYQDLADWQFQLDSGAISAETYSQYLKAFSQAEREGRVQ